MTYTFEHVLDSLESCEGKTIKTMNFCGEPAELSIIFDDGTMIVFTSDKEWYEADASVQIKNEFEPNEARNAGVISEEECLNLERNERAQRDLDHKERELKELARLQEKYKGRY